MSFLAKKSFEKQGFAMPWDKIKRYAIYSAPGALFGALGMAGEALRERSENKRAGSSLERTKRILTEGGGFGTKTELAKQKFDELASIAPRAMQNMQIAMPLLASAVEYGAPRPTDIATITQIESNVHSGKIPRRNLIGAFMEGALGGTQATKNIMDAANASAQAGLAESQSAGGGGPDPMDTPIGTVFTFTMAGREGKQFTSPEDAQAYRENLKRRLAGGEIDPQIMGELASHANWGAAMQRARTAAAETQPTESGGNVEKKGSLRVSPQAAGRALGLQYALVKQAGVFSPKAKDLLAQGAMLAGVSLLTGLGFAGIGKGLEVLDRNDMQAKLDSSFDTAMSRLKTDPGRFSQQALDKLQENPKHYTQYVRDAFDALSTAAPALAANPLVAKDFIETALISESVPIDKLKMLGETQKSVSNVRKDHPPGSGIGSRGFMAGFGMAGGPNAISSTVQGVLRSSDRDSK